MPMPYSFVSGDIAKAKEVNANFEYLLKLMGQLAGPSSPATFNEFQFGPRSTGLLSAIQDTGGSDGNFSQLGWNITFKQVSGKWKYQRVLSGGGGSALRVSTNGVEVYHTKNNSGDLHASMKKVMQVGYTSDAKDIILYLDPNVHLQNVDTNPTKNEHYRLTPVFLDNPIPIYASTSVSKGTTVFNAYNQGVPKNAKGLVIYCHVTAYPSSGAGMHIYQHRVPLRGDIDLTRGMITHAVAGQRAGSQGMVPLGRGGAQEGGYTITRTAAFELANVYITGYLV